MPWKESPAVDERRGFIEEWKKQEEDFAELCRRYSIARKTGYKWAERYSTLGEAGLEEQSRAPHNCPQAIEESIAQAILELRGQHPRWGPRKLRAYLQARQPQPRFVTGHTSAKPDLTLYVLGLNTNAGRRLACSRPACGSNVNQTKSPTSGAKTILTRIPYRAASPSWFPDDGFSA